MLISFAPSSLCVLESNGLEKIYEQECYLKDFCMNSYDSMDCQNL